MNEEELIKVAKQKASEIQDAQTLGIYDDDEALARDIGYKEGYVSGYEEGYLTGAKEQGVVQHDLRKNPEDLPPLSGELHSEMKPVLAYTQDLGWTSAVRRKRGRAIEWYCSNYDGNTIFFDKEIIAWTEIPAPQGL